MKVIEVERLNQFIQANQRDEIVPVPIPIPPPIPIPVPPTPPLTPPLPVGLLGTKTNPIKLDKPYPPVNLGFTHSIKGKEFGLSANSKIYFEVDPALLKANSSAFQMVVKGLNCPTLSIYKAYYDKDIQTYTNDVYFTGKGTLDYVRDHVPRDFDSTKFLYALENQGAYWEIELWVQMLY